MGAAATSSVAGPAVAVFPLLVEVVVGAQSAALSTSPASPAAGVELRGLLRWVAGLSGALRLATAGLTRRSVGLDRRLLVGLLLLLLAGLPLLVARIVPAATPPVRVTASLALLVSSAAGASAAPRLGLRSGGGLAIAVGALSGLGWERLWLLVERCREKRAAVLRC